MGFVKFERQDHVGLITIDRHETLNVLDSQVLSSLSCTIDQVEVDGKIYAVVLKGEDRSLVAGAFGVTRSTENKSGGIGAFLKEQQEKCVRKRRQGALW